MPTRGVPYPKASNAGALPIFGPRRMRGRGAAGIPGKERDGEQIALKGAVIFYRGTQPA